MAQQLRGVTVPFLHTICTRVAAQGLSRSHQEVDCVFSDYEKKVTRFLTEALECYPRVRRAVGPCILAYLVNECPSLVTDRLLSLLLRRDSQCVNLAKCSQITSRSLANWVKGQPYMCEDFHGDGKCRRDERNGEAAARGREDMSQEHCTR